MSAGDEVIYYLRDKMRWCAVSEIETAARDCIAVDFEFISKSYGFIEADVEELIATRDW